MTTSSSTTFGTGIAQIETQARKRCQGPAFSDTGFDKGPWTVNIAATGFPELTKSRTKETADWSMRSFPGAV